VIRSVQMLDAVHEEFTPEEREALAPFFTDLDGPVFCVVNLPEVVKGALFARYSRTSKTLRRLFLDEFLGEGAGDLGRATAGLSAVDVGVERAERLYERVFSEYGDDSVAQLGGVHLAAEQASQILTKVLERGRLAAYLEQSTRYVPYDDRPGGRYRYHVPPEADRAGLGDRFRQTCDLAFDTYARWLGPLQELFRERFPKDPADSDGVYRATIRAKACDTLRGLLPAAARTHVGMYATAQSYESLLLHMRAHPLEEVRAFGDAMLTELRKVIPAFLTRVDKPDRGGAWSEYLAATRESAGEATAKALAGLVVEEPDPPGEDVSLVWFDPEGETKVVAAAMYPHATVPHERLLEVARAMSGDERNAILRAATGERTNRRHRPGRAFEATSYRFDVLCDYGAFRDLQRHRLLTVEWQRLTPEHGASVPQEIEDLGAAAEWAEALDASRILWDELGSACGPDVAQYAVAMAFRVRFVMDMNAREALHLIELRSSPQGHPAYRRVAWQMNDLIRDVAGHRAIADAMTFVDRSDVDLERLEAERRGEARREAALRKADRPASDAARM
jgi:thymidylate synthase ThyX